MSRLTPVSLILGFLLLASSHHCNGDDGSRQDDEARHYRELIEQLVSPNKAPATRNRSGGSVQFPAAYDVKAQERVESARQSLYDHTERALPLLVAALNDPRYSMTIVWAEGDAYYNWSVGDVCRHVIESHLEVYRDKISFLNPQHWNRYNYDVISKEWWQARTKRTLAQLQTEAIDWAIQKRTAEPAADTPDDRNKEVSELQALRNQIASSGKPANPKRMLRMITPKL